ncbi:NACHT domain-containing NTPase [Microbacterium sp.]|uniref:NACHT domain-containing protein n=1 Tax=Microbacterium sp. TaxID=51671 RepID=UPI00273697B8|nr:NACHT domain-containing protein [Microbacterium sp.]MDP3952363.1 NACHT domain-containing protein [Microbacterium sp.]
MVEPVTVVAAAARAAKPAISASRMALRRLRLMGTFEPRWLELGDEKGFTAADVDDLEKFLSQRETRALLSVLAMTLLLPASKPRADSLDTVERFFMNACQRWKADHPARWCDRSEALWRTLVRLYDRATPAGQELADAALEYEDFLRTPIGRIQTEAGSAPAQTRYIERLSELCSEIGRVTDAVTLSEQIKNSLAASPAPPIITYTSTTKPATFADLYVARTLEDKETSAKVEGRRLGTGGAPYRAVVHGAPGAGKSTFVRNLRRELAEQSDGQPALLLTARSYFPAAEHQPILEHLAAGLRTSLSLELTDLQLRDILTLGQAVVIVDGLDEVTDINQRIELVQRISAFVGEFPATSLLVTSRSVGYERAPLPSNSFTTLVLDEYSDEQSREYVRRWFAYIDRPDLPADFQRESESVADLQRNPLLLSLLCVLYRERGSIPRRRRDIYAQCADLLFHTWDSHRHIGQPEELHANGDRIMQEIARWVYTSQKAQNGLPESVIKKTIGNYLRDSVGVEEAEARRRAGEFLEFCADRAWLLGSAGTEHGERVFTFTHRTFFEYFTAEAFSRTSGEPAKIAKILVNAHKRDATSVLPELLLQAIDEKLDRGAASTFTQVCEMTDDETLILRLMEGVPLPSQARARGFDRLLTLWWERKHVSPAAFHALLSLNVDARNQFVRDYLNTDEQGARSLFLGAWASADLNGGTERFLSVWGEHIDSLARNEVANERDWLTSDRPWYQTALEAWLWHTSRGAMPEPPSAALFSTQGTYGPCIGTLWLGLELAVADSAAQDSAELRELFDAATAHARKHSQLPPMQTRRFAESVIDRIESGGFPVMMDPAGNERDTFLYACAILYEATWYQAETHHRVLQLLPPAAKDLWIRREDSGADDKRPSIASRLPSDYPRWLTQWANGKRAFTAIR